MVQEAIDGLTDQQLADLELQESGLVSGQNAGAIAYTPFAQRMNPQPAPAPEPEEPVALSEFQLNQLEEENYRRMDYVMTPQEFDQYWDRRDKEDREVGRFFEGLGQGAAGLIGMVPETGRELQGAMVGMVTDPVNQVQRNVQTGAEIIRKGGINLVQLFDWVGSKVDDLATGSKRAEAINAGIMDRLIADGKVTGDREQDEQIYQAALAEAREAGAYTPTLDQAREDKGKAYERYVREKALERDFANVSEFKTGEGQMSVPTSAGTYQITDEQPMPTISTLGSMVVDPLNALPLGAGALSKARVLRRIANLSEKPMLGAERVASGLADVAERVELGISTRLQDITGLTQKQQAALGAGVAGTAVYVDSATDGGGGITKAVLMAGAVMPALHYGGGLLRKVGSAAGGAATIVREAGVGGLGVARAEAASSLAGNAAVPERYRKFFTGYVDGTDSTLKRVAQDSGNPEALRRGARFADRMGATQVARAADDAVSGAVTAGIVGSPFAALQPDAERAGEVMGGILALGGVGGLAGGVARRAGTAADADIARMFADVQAVGGNVEAFARLPHATLDRLSAMQGVLAGKVDFVPLTGDEYRMNADIAQNGGEATAGVFLDRDANNRARVFINLDGKTATEAIAPHEIGHAILTSNILDGQPRNDLRNLVNQQYGPGGVESRGREYIARMVDADLRQGVTGEAPTVLTDAEMKAMDGGKTMDNIVADRAKDPAERDRLINERVEEFRQRSIDKGEDALDWARDEIVAETFASEAPAIDFRAIRRDAMFPRLAESMLSAGGRVLEVMGARLDPGTGKLMDNPSVLFRDNPLFQDRIMQKRVREYVRSYDQYLAGLEEAGAKELRGVELARSSKPEDLARSTHVKLRDEGRGVLENDFLFQKPDGTYSLKPQKIITATENARSAQIKTLYDARKFVPVNSQEFGKRKVNGREVVGGPVLPPQFDFFTNFPKHVREFARSMEQSRAEGGSWDIDYNAIGTGASGRYRVTNLGNVRAIQRETVPLGWQVTKANHLLAVAIDLNAFRAATMKAINRGELSIFNNDMRQVETDLKIRLANHREGRPGEAGIGQAKRDILNGLIGTGTAVQRAANPLYAELNPRGSLRTWRVDRLNDAKPTGRTGYFFDYDKENNNRMPSALPQTGMAMPDVAVVPERFTGTGQEPNRQSRFAQPPPFFARFPIESYERGGKFFDAQSGDDLTGRSYGAGFIDVSSGKPRLFVDGDPAAQPAKSGRTYRTNLFKQKAGWKWISDNAPATSTIVSVEGGGQHVYALRADFEGGVDLARYSDRPSEPRLRPTARGELSLGNEVGRISIRGKEHPVYDGARISQPAAARGQAMPDISEAPPFYLKSSQALDAKVQGKAATVDQIKAILTNPQNGIKAEELKWTGVMQEVERLAKENNGKVPKEALLRYLAEDGAVRLEEVTMGGAKKQWTQADIDQLEREAQRSRDFSAYERAVLEYEDQQLGSDANNTGNQTQYAQWQLDGGENYREVVLAIPPKETLKQALREATIKFNASDSPTERAASESQIAAIESAMGMRPKEWMSSHFQDVPNYIAHMRLNERVDAKGKQGLFIEELQSDRHQQGREKGYREDLNKNRLNELVRKESSRGITKSEQQELSDLLRQRDALAGGVPDAPFRTSWPLQLFKRALRDAVADGKEWIGWTTGETQAARYDKQIADNLDAVEVTKDKDGQSYYVFGYKGEKRVIDSGAVGQEKLADLIGKEMATKAIEGKQEKMRFSGSALTIGGKGMEGFYDQIVLKDVAKYVKQWGAQVEKSGITVLGPLDDLRFDVVGPDNRAITAFETMDKAKAAAKKAGQGYIVRENPPKEQTKIWRVNITPQMRDGIQKAGQALFMPDVDYPIKGFHGGPKGIQRLKASSPWSRQKDGKDGVIYISTDEAGAEYYADLRDDGRVYDVAARASNPYYTSDQDLLIDPSPEDVRRLKSLGHDAIFPVDPQSTLRAFFNDDQVVIRTPARGQAMPDVVHDDNYTLPPQVPDRGFYIIGTKPTADGRVLEYHVDPRTTMQPRVAGIDSISGEQVAMLEADRHNTRGDNMGGPLHPFLINNQTVVYLPDGRGYKPVWANMNSGFVTRAKNIVKNTTAGHALIQIMKENAHRSNRKFVMDVTAEIDARRASMSDDQADFLHVLLELGAINPQGRINQAYSRVERLSKEVLKKEAELSELAEAEKQYNATFAKYRPMAEFLSRLSPLKSHSTRGRMKEFQGEFGSLVSKYRNEPWYSAMSSKYRNTKFVDEAARFSFKQRGAAMDRITGIPFAPDVKAMLNDSMDFVNGKNLDVVGVVQLSKDADAFAVYFGKNAKEESKMSANERLLRDQLLASGTFRPHPSYDWVMLGPENADSFILNAPADPLKLFPDYAKNHPNPKVRGGTKETVAGTMKKSKIPLILK
jgi:hypothetical protein